jgi:hypothetical protein
MLMPNSSQSRFWIALTKPVNYNEITPLQFMKIFLYLLLSLAPIAVAYTKVFDGSRIKEPLIAVSFLSVMLWSVLFSTIMQSLTGVEIKYTVAVFALVMGYSHFRLIQLLAKRRRSNQ